MSSIDESNSGFQIDPEMIEIISRDLSTRGFCVIPRFFPEDIVQQANTDFEKALGSGAFKRAGIGTKQTQLVADDVRKDEILWLEAGASEPIRRKLLDAFDDLRVGLNQRLYLGLWELETHYAHYPSGGFYHRHLDRFASDDARMISLVTYLNFDWKPTDGGHLMIYANIGDPDPVQIVEPQAGTLVCFRSDLIEHEVIPALASRRSLAGWFRRRTL